MMDLQEATKTLDAYSTLLVSKTRFWENAPSPETAEGKSVIEKLVAALKVETKGAMIISILLWEEIIKHHEQFVVGFTDELAELVEALNRSHEATDKARKATLAYEGKSRIKAPEESPSAKVIREFREKQRKQPN
jgi:hypothetical protein